MNDWNGIWSPDNWQLYGSTIVYRAHFLPVASTYYRGSRIWKDWVFTAKYSWNTEDWGAVA